jgi:hypothetical protein
VNTGLSAILDPGRTVALVSYAYYSGGSPGGSGTKATNQVTQTSALTYNQKTVTPSNLSNGAAITYSGSVANQRRNDALVGFISSIEDNIAFSGAKRFYELVRGYPYKDEYDDEYEYYLGRTAGDIASMLLAAGMEA